MDHGFGALLREWRSLRRMSQLELGIEAAVSARHISFLETGRARPSREMVLHLGEVLDVPRSDRNRLLEAAGFVAAYRARPLESGEMLAVRQAAEWMIGRHEPYPAIMVDRHWHLLGANRAAWHLLGGFGLAEGDSFLDALLGDGMRAAIDNWPEFGRHLLTRLRAENAAVGGDAVLEHAIARVASDATLASASPRPLPPFVPTRFRSGETVLSFLSTLAHFSGAEDVLLADLRIELLFPADEVTKDLLLALAGEGG
ncbi:MAG: helix-turn-helix transcriptional regulator [Myxococcales bacterium]|nr:helix-turn-helix transcriptional regulator [Myxococcales bacterium]